MYILHLSFTTQIYLQFTKARNYVLIITQHLHDTTQTGTKHNTTQLQHNTAQHNTTTTHSALNTTQRDIRTVLIGYKRFDFFLPDAAAVCTHPGNSTANPGIFKSALQSGKNKSATNPIMCGRVNPDIFESDDVANSCPVSLYDWVIFGFFTVFLRITFLYPIVNSIVFVF